MSIWNYANLQLKDLVAYEPGKPIEDVARDLGLAPESIIKMASNENPLGPSPKAIVAMRDAVKDVHIYPDGASYRLRQALAEKFDLEMGNLIIGCGSNEIIEFIGHAFLQPGDNIITAKHAFLVYKLMAKVFGADTIEVPDPGYVHDLDAMLAEVTAATQLICVCNPNNPTGAAYTEKELRALTDVLLKHPHVWIMTDDMYEHILYDDFKFATIAQVAPALAFEANPVVVALRGSARGQAARIPGAHHEAQVRPGRHLALVVLRHHPAHHHAGEEVEVAQDRIGDVAADIALEMGLPEKQVKGVRLAGYVHDIGKISGSGFAFGYLGGLLALIIMLLLLAENATTGKTLLGIDPLFGLDAEARERSALAEANESWQHVPVSFRVCPCPSPSFPSPPTSPSSPGPPTPRS